MPRLTFPYVPAKTGITAGHPGQETIFRPQLVCSVLARNGQSIRWIFLADSGADTCLAPLGLARLLGIDLQTLPQAQMGGLGRELHVGYYAPVVMALGKGLAFQAQLGFSAALDQYGFGLLGQAGFFEAFDVEFRHKERLFTVASR